MIVILAFGKLFNGSNKIKAYNGSLRCGVELVIFEKHSIINSSARI